MSIFEDRESNVRTYCRSFPEIFDRAQGAFLYSETGRPYLDFLCGAGALNYGHNNDAIMRPVLEYAASGRILHGLDLHTSAKRDFLETFVQLILAPRGLNYKVQFCGPTESNAVEAALKLARKITGRSAIFALTGSYHGLSLGSLSVSGSKRHRAAAGTELGPVTFIPYNLRSLPDIDSIAYINAMLKDSFSGTEKPAAIIFETVQAEGGVIVAQIEWMRRLKDLCASQDILLICDDIQVGCGRTGPFFSFERAGITPDMVVLSKSISGYGAPMSLLLIDPKLDAWEAGEHTGTFRGYQLAFVGAKASLEYWQKEDLESRVREVESYIQDYLTSEIRPLHEGLTVRGIGAIWGIDFSAAGGETAAQEIARQCFADGLIIEQAGRDNAVLKLMPPLTIENELLEKGCEVLKRAVSLAHFSKVEAPRSDVPSHLT
jgi:diaminobutyrate-2-oxoglutarate transaminase